MIDLRSDTFTKPSAAMRVAISEAEVGDDVFGEDPSVNRLESLLAEMFGFEAALFCPTATMCNQIAMKVHTQPMDEIICDRLSHIYNYEVGGYAFLSGCSIRTIETERGLLTADDIEKNINPIDVHKPISSLVCLENTCNKGGGGIYPMQQLKDIAALCQIKNIKLHLDGSRLFNALVESGQEAVEYEKIFDSITICLSKGLGCPAGAILLGNVNFIEKARRVRKVFGGGMRQAGILAAAGIYAIHNNIDRLKEDHVNAKTIAELLEGADYIEKLFPVETNIVLFKLKPEIDPEKYLEYLNSFDIQAFHLGEGILRFVFHMDIKNSDIPVILDCLSSFRK